MRPSTIRLASAASAARRTLIPFASRAAAVRLTRASSRRVPNRRLIDLSKSVWSSVVIDAPFRRCSAGITCKCNYIQCALIYEVWCIRLRMQVRSKPDVTALFDRLMAKELPGRRGLEAWRSLLQAHATLMRQLDTDLEKKTGLALADFDVLGQLALAGGELRMTDLAARALISRSGMTRRVSRLVDEGLVRRADTDADGRGVVVVLTDAGVARLTEAAPVHLRGVSDLFVARLNQKELVVLKSVMNKVTVDCTFG